MNSEKNHRDSDIAVVGASALYPGSVGGASFWTNILAGRDFISEVPPDHWLIDDYYDADPRAPGKVYARRGGFLPKIDFDPMQHGLPPKQLSTTDTAQLLGLVVAQKVLDDAASVQFGKVDKKNISVILGVASATELVGQMAARIQRPHWIKALRDAGLPESEVQSLCDRIESTYPEWDESTFPGLLGNVVAGRIANRLNLGGTNCVIDAACASSLGAVAMAVQELQLGHSDLVITGGVDALNDIFMFMCFSKTPALSPTGDCRPFSEDADGTMLGEGLGMLALRRLSDAERDGDKIYAVIRGIGSSSDGRAKSIYAPRAEGQELAIRRAYERAGYGPEEVGLVEAHGTATKAGDLAEFSGLRRAFEGAAREDRQWCALGSIKSQIGHTKAAAGAASLFKVVMALHHKVLPPTIKVSKPNAKLEIEQTPFYLNTRMRPWIQAHGKTRKGSVSSFGFGGSNFHIALEEYAGEKSTARRVSNLPLHMLLLDAADAKSLMAKADALRVTLRAEPLPLAARNSQLAFNPQSPYRLAVLAADEQAGIGYLAHAIGTIAQDPAKPFTLANRMHYGIGSDKPKLAFLFPGQGSQYVDMGAALASEFEVARRVWDETAALELDPDHKLHEVVFPIPVFTEQEQQAQAALLTRTDWAQPAIGATSLSMLRLLEQLGVRPDATAGHSYGEITALHAAGAIPSSANLLAVSRRRGELMRQAASTPGAMMAVRASGQQVEQWIAGHGIAEVSIANYNSPNQVVVAGASAAIERFQQALEADKVSCHRLPVATAFHTEMVAGCAEPFGQFLSDVAFDTPRVAVYANTSAAPYPADLGDMRANLAQQLAKPVRFEEMIRRMHADGYRLFVEVGPGSALTGMVSDCLKGQEHIAVCLDSRKLDGRAALVNALAVLSAQGIAVDYAALWQEFASFEAPEDASKLSPATVKLSGANYGKPYPPVEGAAAVPKPNPERPAQQVVQTPAVQPVAAAPAARPVSPMMQPTRAQPSPEWASAFATLQQHTLEAQKAFTQTLSDSHQAFLRASEAAFMQLGQMAGTAQAVVMPAAMPIASVQAAAVAAPAVTPVVASIAAPLPTPTAAPAPLQMPAAGIDHQALLLEVVAEKTGYPVAMLTLDMELEAGLGIDSIKRVEILSALQEKIPQLSGIDPSRLAALNTLGEIVAFAAKSAPAAAAVATPARPAAPATPVTAAVDHQGLLLEVVAEKTGYPVSMLSLDMELEAGLGIDSIKRVEILSALQEKIPQLAGIDPAQLAALNTLGEIVAFAAKSAPAAPQAASIAPAAETASAADYQGLLLQVVAEKTGYPIGMLTLDMELEAGLGIDSIKRVEILSALQEKIPQLSGIDPAQLAALNTLGEIVAFASGQTGATAAPVASARGNAAPVGDYKAMLLAVVAEKTGYPESMLTLDMELEAGLGIDSIKRVEILSALQEKIPQLSGVDTGRLASLNTLGEIVDFACGSTGDMVQKEAVAATPPAAGLKRLAVRAAETPSAGLVTPGLLQADPLYIVGGGDIAAMLAEQLNAADIKACVVAEPPADARSVMLLTALDTRDDSAAAQAQCNEAVFRQLQACAASMAVQGNLLITVQNTGGDFGIGGSAGNRAWSAGITAAAKTAALEWPQVSVKAIDIDIADRESTTIAQALARELLAGGPQREVGLHADGRRVSPQLFAEQLAASDASAMPDDGVIVVTGGGRGVTAACLSELIPRMASARIAILGRTALQDEPASLSGLTTDAQLKQALLTQYTQAGKTPTPQQLGAEVREIMAQRELRANLDKFAALGATIRYFAVDVADAASVAQTIATIRDSFGPIRGLVHAAGVLADKEIRQKTLAQFQKVLSTKLDGFRHLLEATRQDALTHILCFSSVAARTGNIGQIDYAMANEVLNRVCQAERARRGNACLVKSIGWGPWAGGMVDSGLEKRFAAMGVALIPLAEGARLFADEYCGLNGDTTELVFGGGLGNFGAVPGNRVDDGVFEVRFHRDTHPWLESHVIRGVAVVPMVVANDLALQAVRALYPGELISATADLNVNKGIQLQHFETSGDRFRIECQREEGKNSVVVRITNSVGALHYTVHVLLGDQAATREHAALTLQPWQPESGAIYDGRLFHGPDLQVIFSLDGIAPEGCAGRLASRSAQALGYAAPVDLLDGGLQLAVLWVHEHMGCESLPTGVGHFRVHREWPRGEEVRCEAYCESRTSLMTQWTVLYRNASGELLASIEGLKIHLLPDAPSQRTQGETVRARIA